MKKILFLDDNKARHRDIKPHLLHDEAYTAGEAIELLKNKQYDIVFLDHDLGGKEMVSSFAEEETGYTVAQWIAENKPNIPLVVVHSLNPAGSDNITGLLKNHGYYVLQQGFIGLKNVVPQILSWVMPDWDVYNQRPQHIDPKDVDDLFKKLSHPPEVIDTQES